MFIRMFPLTKNVIRSRDVATMAFNSFACPKETKQRKRHFFEGIFWLWPKTVFDFLKLVQGCPIY